MENPKVQDYCQMVRLDCYDRWAHAFSVQQALNIVNTNNGIEAHNQVFKYSYLPRSLDKLVSGIVVMLMESFVPESFISTLPRREPATKQFLPDYLHNCPPYFVKHCLRTNFAAADFSENDVNCINS